MLATPEQTTLVITPFTSPASCGSQMQQYASWSEATTAITIDAAILQKPFLVQAVPRWRICWTLAVAPLQTRKYHCSRIGGRIPIQRGVQAGYRQGLRKGLMLSRRSSPIVLAHGCRQNNTIANLCVAAYDMVKGGRDFGYSDSVRYMFSGDRSVVVAPLVALVAFTKKSRWITAGDGDSGKGSLASMSSTIGAPAM